MASPGRPSRPCALIAFPVLLCLSASGQTAAPPLQPSPFRVIAHDQAEILTSPARIARRDWKWILPAAGSLAFFIAADSRTMQQRVHSDPQARDRSLAISNAATAALAGLPLFLYWRGWRTADDQSRDTGRLAIRAAVDGLLTAGIVRAVTQRQRPAEGAGDGRFFHYVSASSSFPSLHSTAAWAVASVVAERYPGWLTRTAVYGAAAAVSLTRVTGREHFPADVLAGSLLGFAIGHHVARSAGPAPHDPAPAHESSPEETARRGSVYVPLDSWIYPALDRLAALGLIPSQTSGLRPWTRAECRRQWVEAEQRAGAAPAIAGPILSRLRRELTSETEGSPLAIDSVYVRGGVIAGPVLDDSFHFGQTWTNDFGRPFGRGFNSVDGFTAHAESGPVFASVQGEFQHAPGADPYPFAVRQAIAGLDATPIQPGDPRPATDRFRVIDAYAGVRLGVLQFSAGQQSLWWGPTYGAPLSFSTNAEPTKNLKISSIHPVYLPGFLRHLGGIRGEFVMGKLGGQQYTWRPWFNAQKISFKLTENLEMGFTRWAIFWGVGHPITIGSFVRDFTSTTSPDGPGGVGRGDPGDRKGGFDFRYRVPGLRNWLTLYSDSYCDDDPSPLAAPRRSAISPGIYLSHVPGIPHLDLRAEAPSSTLMGLDQGGQFLYFNNQYRSGNTNYGTLLGNPVGRDGRAQQAWATYWFSARDKLEFGYRQFKASPKFLPGGATQSDASVRASLEFAQHWQAAAGLQYERFWVPLLGGPRHNLSAWLQLTWEPRP